MTAYQTGRNMSK